MSPLLFLGVAAVVFAVLASGAWLFQRERRTTFESSIDQFRDEMHALAPDWHQDGVENQ